MAKNNNLGDFLKGIADKFRSKLGTADTINPQNFEDKIDAVYEAAAQKAYNDFWDGFQQNGKRTNYEYAFARWNYTGTGDPKYKITLDSNSTDGMMFCRNTQITKITADKYDFSQAHCEDAGYSVSGHYNTFFGCSNLEKIEDAGLKSGYYYETFRDCAKLHTIAILRFNKATLITTACFKGCTTLKNISFEGTVGKSISFLDSPLTADSVKSLLDHLDTAEYGETRTITLKTASKTAYDEKYGDWDAKVAYYSTNGNWTFTLI